MIEVSESKLSLGMSGIAGLLVGASFGLIEFISIQVWHLCQTADVDGGIGPILILYGFFGSILAIFTAAIINTIDRLPFFHRKFRIPRYSVFLSSLFGVFFYFYSFVFLNRILWPSKKLWDPICLTGDCILLLLTLAISVLVSRVLTPTIVRKKKVFGWNVKHLRIIANLGVVSAILLLVIKLLLSWFPEYLGISVILPKSPRKNVVVIIIDTLRPDHLSLYGYPIKTSPSIDQMGREGTVFLNAFSIGGCSEFAAPGLKPPGIRNSKYFRKRGELHKRDAPPSVEFLKVRGYEFTEFYWYIPPFIRKAKRTILGKEIICRLYKRLWEILQTSVAMQWLSSNPEGSFVYICYLAPHQPYQPPYPFNRRFFADSYTGVYRSLWARNPQRKFIPFGEWRTQLANYDGEIAFVDYQIGRFFSFLKKSGLSKNTIVILTSDQGEELFERGSWGHPCDTPLYNELIRVPLIIWGPGEVPEGLKVPHHVTHADIIPTMLDILKLGNIASETFSGQSLVPLIRGDQEQKARPVLAHASNGFAVILGQWKLLVYQGTRRLFDLKRDPMETIDLSLQFPGKARELERLARSMGIATIE